MIIATGSEYRKLDIPGEAEYSGKGVSYCATCDGFFFRDKPIIVVGGGDSAFTEADFLSRFGSSVTLIHRRSEFRASQILVERAQQNPKITIVTDSVVEEILGDDNGAQSVNIRNVITGETSTIAANGILWRSATPPPQLLLTALCSEMRVDIFRWTAPAHAPALPAFCSRRLC